MHVYEIDEPNRQRLERVDTEVGKARIAKAGALPGSAPARNGRWNARETVPAHGHYHHRHGLLGG
jgi:hypothetical protein